MALSTLADLVPEMERLGDREALRYDNGFRTFRFSYRELLGRVRIFQGYLASRDVGSGSRVILWSENRPEWVFAFWACVLSGIQVVPLDSHSSLEMIGRILEQVEADLLCTVRKRMRLPGRIGRASRGSAAIGTRCRRRVPESIRSSLSRFFSLRAPPVDHPA